MVSEFRLVKPPRAVEDVLAGKPIGKKVKPRE